MPEFMGQGDDVARAPGVGHVHARRARLAKARAVGTRAFARPDGALDPVLLRHHLHEIPHLRRDGGIALSDQAEGLFVGDRGRFGVRQDGGRCSLIPGAVAGLPVGLGLQPRRSPRERHPFLRNADERVNGLPAHAVRVRRRIEIMDAVPTPSAHRQPPTCDGIDGRRTRLDVLIPSRIDRSPSGLAQMVRRAEHQAGRLGDSQGPCLVAERHLAGKGSGQLVVEHAPSLDSVLGQAVHQRLLLQGQQFMAALALVFDSEPACRGAVVVEVRLRRPRPVRGLGTDRVVQPHSPGGFAPPATAP